MKRATFALSVFVGAMLCGCVDTARFPQAEGGYYVGGHEIMGADFYLCSSTVRWMGSTVEFDRLRRFTLNYQSHTPESRSFRIAKLGFSNNQIEQLKDIGTGIESMFAGMCGIARALQRRPGKYFRFLNRARKESQEIFSALRAMEEINDESNDPHTEITEEQRLYQVKIMNWGKKNKLDPGR